MKQFYRAAAKRRWTCCGACATFDELPPITRPPERIQKMYAPIGEFIKCQRARPQLLQRHEVARRKRSGTSSQLMPAELQPCSHVGKDEDLEARAPQMPKLQLGKTRE
jgi:hypothetical protein